MNGFTVPIFDVRYEYVCHCNGVGIVEVYCGSLRNRRLSESYWMLKRPCVHIGIEVMRFLQGTTCDHSYQTKRHSYTFLYEA